jgi:hypothetical protein
MSVVLSILAIWGVVSLTFGLLLILGGSPRTSSEQPRLAAPKPTRPRGLLSSREAVVRRPRTARSR